MTEEKNLSASATSSPPSGSDSAYNSLLQRYLNTVPCVKRKKERKRERERERERKEKRKEPRRWRAGLFYPVSSLLYP